MFSNWMEFVVYFLFYPSPMKYLLISWFDLKYCNMHNFLSIFSFWIVIDIMILTCDAWGDSMCDLVCNIVNYMMFWTCSHFEYIWSFMIWRLLKFTYKYYSDHDMISVYVDDCGLICFIVIFWMFWVCSYIEFNLSLIY